MHLLMLCSFIVSEKKNVCIFNSNLKYLERNNEVLNYGSTNEQ